MFDNPQMKLFSLNYVVIPPLHPTLSLNTIVFLCYSSVINLSHVYIHCVFVTLVILYCATYIHNILSSLSEWG